MKTIAPEADEAGAEKSDFKPLTAEQARQWRQQNPSLSVWWLVAGQALVGTLVALLAWGLTGSATAGWSAAWGALAVVAPAALFARAVLRHKAGIDARAALLSFVGWECAKLALTLALLAVAVRWLPGLNWVALLAGMVGAMKMYWVALWVRPGVRKTVLKELSDGRVSPYSDCK